MGSPKSTAKTVREAVAEERRKAQEVDDRRQTQIARQVKIIDRLTAENSALRAELGRG